jgi:hypothetical protein
LIKAIETKYGGYHFRSRLEARWAVFFDALGVEWKYEHEGFDLGDFGYYLPDFWLPDFKWFIEVKGTQQMIYEGEPSPMEKAEKLFIDSGNACIFFFDIPRHAASQEWFGGSYNHGELHRTIATNFKDCRIEESEEMDGCIRCPVCGGYYVHFCDPNLHPERLDSEMTIPMWCEEGCRWSMFLRCHAGSTSINLIYPAIELELPGHILAGGDEQKLERAFTAARQARFEHRGRA